MFSSQPFFGSLTRPTSTATPIPARQRPGPDSDGPPIIKIDRVTVTSVQSPGPPSPTSMMIHCTLVPGRSSDGPGRLPSLSSQGFSRCRPPPCAACCINPYAHTTPLSSAQILRLVADSECQGMSNKPTTSGFKVVLHLEAQSPLVENS